MPDQHVRRVCKRCHEGPKCIKARGLCESCWMKVKALGQLEDWPRLDMIRKHLTGEGYCRCFSPIPERLHMWDASQCLKCGKKLLDAR